MKNRIYYCVEKGYFDEKTTELSDSLQPDYVLVKYLFCGICGGDYSTYIGRRISYPASLGHEFVAEVIQIGKNVNNVHPGQFVISDFNFRCGKCVYCKQHKSHLCIKNDIQKFSNRAFAEYGIIHKKYLYQINMYSNLPQACFIEPLSCVLHAIEIFQPSIDMPILINGAGSIGTMMVFYLKTVLHHENIYVNDLNPSRLNNVIQCFQVEQFDKTQAPPTYIIECTNDVEGVKEVLHLAPQGAYMCVMSHLYGENTSFIYEEMCRKELHCCYPLRNGEVRNIYRAIDYITKYWSEEMDILYFVDNNINDLFQTKEKNPFNKQILDIQNSFKNVVS